MIYTIRNVAIRFFKERFFDQAAQTAYYLLLAIFPFLLFLLSLLSLLPVNEEMILSFLSPFVPVEAFNLIEANISVILRKRQGHLVYTSLLLAFWISSVAVQSLSRSMDLAYGSFRRYAFWKVLIRDLGITFLFMLVISLSLFLPLIEKALHEAVMYYDTIEQWRGWMYVWPGIRWGLGTVFLFLFFMLFYKVVPTHKVKWHQTLPGTLFSTFGWQLFSIVFGEYVTNVDYTRLYGQLSGIILLVIWFYMTAIILLISGLLNAEFRKRGRLV